jgi:hypothetical protein
VAQAAQAPPGVNVLNISRSFDTGGQGWRIYDAFRRLTDWNLRSMYRPNAFEYLAYPTDLAWDADTARRLYDEADVIHLHNGFSTADILERNRKPKPSIVHYHGTAFRQNPNAHLHKQRQRGSIGITSTLDLWLISPGELEWLPSPYNLEWLDGLRR